MDYSRESNGLILIYPDINSQSTITAERLMLCMQEDSSQQIIHISLTKCETKREPMCEISLVELICTYESPLQIINHSLMFEISQLYVYCILTSVGCNFLCVL